jgi:hypothetical protein
VGDCSKDDYILTGALMNVADKKIPAGNPKGAWGGATIEFNNTDANQDGCKGATVNLVYTVS